MMYECLAPTGEIRIALAVGPTKSAVWTTVPDGSIEPEGVTVDMARRMGELTGLPVKLVQLTSSAHIIETANAGIWDISFTPVDGPRREIVDFGEPFHVGESSYLVRTDSAFMNAQDLHQAGVTIIGVEGTATLRSAEKVAGGALIIRCANLTLAAAAFDRAEGDALALGRLALEDMSRRMPGTRVTTGNFHIAETAVAVPKGRPEVLRLASDLVRQMKAAGTVMASFQRHDMPDAIVPL